MRLLSLFKRQNSEQKPLLEKQASCQKNNKNTLFQKIKNVLSNCMSPETQAWMGSFALSLGIGVCLLGAALVSFAPPAGLVMSVVGGALIVSGAVILATQVYRTTKQK